MDIVLSAVGTVAVLAVLALNEYNRRKRQLSWAPARWEYVAVGLIMVAALLALAWAPVQAGLPPVEEPAIPVPASPGDYCDDNPDAVECRGDDEPVLGPGGCSSDTLWACHAHHMFLPEVRA